MRWCVPFLAFIFVGELIAKYEGRVLGLDNYNIYYILFIGESVFYAYIFYNFTSSSGLKKVIIYLTIPTVINYLIGFCFYLSVSRYIYVSSMIASFLLVVISLSYLYLKCIDNDTVWLVSEPGFWVSLGVSLFYSVLCLAYSLSHLVRTYDLYFFGQKFYNWIANVMCIVLYGSISVGIILCKRKTPGAFN